MALIGGYPDSNQAPKSGANLETDTGSGLGMLGYVNFPFPAEMPAQSNFDVSITKDLSLSSVNQGTSLNSYRRQPGLVDPEAGIAESGAPSDDFGPAPGGKEQGQAVGGDFASQLSMASVPDNEPKPADRG